ncbi:hypothetical protein [Flavobacterium yafengii]|uniref:hypothetical protein n=1 Tax=Flavobacterium yafengii TaxID=3041253 RepID=UPI0024A91C71|nr:hypothetical protein [Flavobacterium yafengii]MDI5899649.1 hypothetical protein [Flavobacterium yafengii]
MKYILTAFLFYSLYSHSQLTTFGDKINGNPLEYKETFYEAKKIKNKFEKGKYLYDDIFTKNTNGEFVKQTTFPLEKWETPQNTFNEKKQKTLIEIFSEDGTVNEKTKFIYTENKLVEEEYYLADTLSSKYKYEYKNGNKAKKIEYSLLKNVPISTVDYSYDSNNNLIKESYKYSSDQEDINIYEYNEKNFLTKYYRKLSFPPSSDIEPKIAKKITYVKYDNYNWTEVFFEDCLDCDSGSKIYFIERDYKY